MDERWVVELLDGTRDWWPGEWPQREAVLRTAREHGRPVVKVYRAISPPPKPGCEPQWVLKQV